MAMRLEYFELHLPMLMRANQRRGENAVPRHLSATSRQAERARIDRSWSDNAECSWLRETSCSTRVYADGSAIWAANRINPVLCDRITHSWGLPASNGPSVLERSLVHDFALSSCDEFHSYCQSILRQYKLATAKIAAIHPFECPNNTADY